MRLTEFAEKFASAPLMKWQKMFLGEIEKSTAKNGIVVCISPRKGKQMVIKIIEEYQKTLN